MKIETHVPKFQPNDKVLFYCHSKHKLILASIEYCLFDKFSEKWSYSLAGWCANFAEYDLTPFEFVGNGLKFTYEI